VANEGITGTGFAASTEKIGTYKITSNEQIDISGTNPAQGGLTAGSYTTLSGDALTQISVVSATKASSAISTIDIALSQVSDIRSALGAITNRLESTVSNLRTVSENLSASDSRIRDADFAAETASLTKAQILQQAGIAILAQANVAPQAALTLLR